MKEVGKKSVCEVIDFGLIDYDRAYTLQKQYVDVLLKGGPQVLMLCEHSPVLTLGRLADRKHILASREDIVKRQIVIRSIDRGGDITLHAPGQLVIYPVLDLHNFKKDLRLYLSQLEQLAIDLLSDFDIVADRFPGRTGVWTEGRKIVSVGIGVRKWIAYHGLAVNVCTDLKLFTMIRPCGLDVQMTSMSEVTNRVIQIGDVKRSIVGRFEKIFPVTSRVVSV